MFAPGNWRHGAAGTRTVVTDGDSEHPIVCRDISRTNGDLVIIAPLMFELLSDVHASGFFRERINALLRPVGGPWSSTSVGDDDQDGD